MLSITRTYLNATRAENNTVYSGSWAHINLYIHHRHRPNMHDFEYQPSLLSSFNGWTMALEIAVQFR